MRLLQDKVINTHTRDIKPHGMSLVEMRFLVIYYANIAKLCENCAFP